MNRHHNLRATSRRHILKSGLALGSAIALPSWYLDEVLAQDAPAQPKSPNDKPGIGLVGCGGRGRGILKEAAKFGNVVAVCDVDASNARLAGTEHDDVPRTGDFRELIARKDVDVVLNGTPDHWHTLVNLHAVKNGKDVYSEKPLTLTIDEGKRLVAAVREHKRVLQTGSQQRSDPQFRLVCELVRNGRLGKLSKVTTIVPAGLREGPFKAAPVPQGLDWDMWLGQAPKVEYVPERCHVTFRFWYDYSGGTITDWGAHHNDIARWGLGDVAGPVAVEAKRLADPIPGGYTTVPQYRVEYTYADGLTHVCQSTTADSIFGSLDREPPPGERHNGVVFEGEHGWIYVRRGHLEASDPKLLSEPLPSNAERLYASNDHMGNFFECVRSRKDPICDVETGHRSVSICHLGAIATRLGRKLKWDPKQEVFVDDSEANGYVAREQRKPWTYEAV